jgi:glutamate/aspartate transport system substrate-binding protein
MRIIAGLDDVDSFRLLNSDQARAFAMDDVLLYGLLASEPRAADFQVSELALSVEPYALMLPPDPAFKRLVDEALRELFASGEIQAIYRRWFESPLADKGGVNLRMPMSAALKKAIARPTDSADPAAYR